MKIGIVGLGLMGGSLGRAIIKRTEHQVYGYDISEDTMLKAELLRAIDGRLNNDNINEMDIIFYALCPKQALVEIEKNLPYMKDNSVVAELCGNKVIMINGMQELNKKYPKINFIGLHPMAGREFCGIAHSTNALYDKASIIFVSVNTPIKIMSDIKHLFLSIGAENIVVTTKENHDKMIAYTSQLAHVISSSYVKNPKSAIHAGYSAGSFRDLTRVAKLNPDMWSELFLENKDNLTEDIDCLISELTKYRDAIASDDQDKLKKLLSDGVKSKEIAEQSRKELKK